MTNQVSGKGKAMTKPPSAYEHLELTRDIVKDTRGVYALRVKGNGLLDALIGDGDIVILRRVSDADEVKDGDMCAVYVKSRAETVLRRFYREGMAGARLVAERHEVPSLTIQAGDWRIEGRVIAVIRKPEGQGVSRE